MRPADGHQLMGIELCQVTGIDEIRKYEGQAGNHVLHDALASEA
jgi:hypothetical protein